MTALAQNEAPPVKPPIFLTIEEMEEVEFTVRRQAKTDAASYDVFESESINKLAGLAISRASVEVRCEGLAALNVFQYGQLFFSYLDAFVTGRRAVRA
jgi:hypothetical protein